MKTLLETEDEYIFFNGKFLRRDLMKVIAIMGSPRRGNGYKIVQDIEEQLKFIGDIDFKYIFLSDIDLKMCKGCFICFSKGEDFCPLKDEKANIEKEIILSDGIILCSPGYAWNVSGLMKNFIDRFAYSLHRPKFFKQSLMLVANGGAGVNKTIKALSLTLGGSKKVCELPITATPYISTKDYSEKVARNIKRSAKKFYNSMANDSHKSIELGSVIWFRLFKKMASISKETIPADYEYYKEKKKYFFETNINPVKSIIADLIACIAVWSLSKKITFK
ncbi:MAG: flavodoxin family protein [Clostridia bacterium]|nr:flavodoxin family protein [Clostridia bacterium]